MALGGLNSMIANYALRCEGESVKCDETRKIKKMHVGLYSFWIYCTVCLRHDLVITNRLFSTSVSRLINLHVRKRLERISHLVQDTRVFRGFEERTASY